MPYYNDTNTKVGPYSYTGSASVDTTIYGDAKTFKTDYFVVNHRGYLFAREGGQYTFQSASPDDITMVWLGPNAYSGYSNATGNWILRNPYGTGNTLATATLTQGQYYPMRVMYANAQQAASLQFSVKSPSGAMIVDSQGTTNSQYLVQFSCDGVAKPYPLFGKET
jgi:hypothetical protein